MLQEEQPPEHARRDAVSVGVPAEKECPASSAMCLPGGSTASRRSGCAKPLLLPRPDENICRRRAFQAPTSIEETLARSGKREERARAPGFVPGGSRIQRWRCGWLVLHRAATRERRRRLHGRLGNARFGARRRHLWRRSKSVGSVVATVSKRSRIPRPAFVAPLQDYNFKDEAQDEKTKFERERGLLDSGHEQRLHCRR